jgi:hypothetical protein
MKKQPDHEKAATNPYDLNSPAPAQFRKKQDEKVRHPSDPYNLDKGPATPDKDTQQSSHD